MEPFHLFRYLDEESFRFNSRKVKDADRFVNVLRGVTGRRLTYRGLTGKGCPLRENLPVSPASGEAW